MRTIFLAAAGLQLTAAGSTASSQSASAPSPAGAPTAAADEPETCMPRGFSFRAGPTYKSVEQLPDGRFTFRLCAPDAHEVKITSSDIADIIPMGFPPGTPMGLPLTKDDKGLWSITTDKPVPADTYRFNFQVDGARVPDPQASTWSEEVTGINSTFEAKGADGDFQTYRQDVAHGMVTEIEYWSTSLGIKRRAHVYTPPGYMNGNEAYPILYLVHGAGDSDDSWTSVGHANYILDNLIAAGKAKPMIIVMPAGHTPAREGADMLTNTDFGDDLIKDLMPYVEGRYRTINTADARAMAGLSMGGAHTINFGLPHPELFHSIGIFSMGLGMNDDMKQVDAYRENNAAALKRAAGEDKLVYYAMGKDDFLWGTVKPTRALLDTYGIKHVFNESTGGHTWINWRRYFYDFAPRLFR